MTGGSALLNARSILAALGVTRGMRVVDIGAGNVGSFAFAAGERVGEDGVVYAVDIRPSALSMLRGTRALRHMPHVEPLWGDAERLGGIPLEEHSMDMAFLVHLCHAVPQPSVVVREVLRLLKRSGTVLVVDWHPEADHPLAKLLPQRFAARDADACFAAHGCMRERVLTPSAWHWGRVYRA